MKLGETIYVVVDADNKVTGDGGSAAIYSERFYAGEAIRDGRLFGEDLRIAKVQLDEVEDYQ